MFVFELFGNTNWPLKSFEGKEDVDLEFLRQNKILAKIK